MNGNFLQKYGMISQKLDQKNYWRQPFCCIPALLDPNSLELVCLSCEINCKSDSLASVFCVRSRPDSSQKY